MTGIRHEVETTKHLFFPLRTITLINQVKACLEIAVFCWTFEERLKDPGEEVESNAKTDTWKWYKLLEQTKELERSRCVDQKQNSRNESIVNRDLRGANEKLEANTGNEVQMMTSRKENGKLEANTGK